MNILENTYKNRKVLITGNTGFKGSWLSLWLKSLGAEVYGISKNNPSDPCLFEVLSLEKEIDHYYLDIRDLKQLTNLVINIEPDFIFHLAAQPIVSLSYTDPIETISSNVIGTANILEAANYLKNNSKLVIITSDKSYENVEWSWGYRENDPLGGKDVYSGSKAAAEAVISSYFHSFIKHKKNLKLAVARAGNVIGGGDWAKDRIVVDSILAWISNEVVNLRNPNATRPWQHVLEPLSGYLLLGALLNNDINGEAFNFGPNSDQNNTVGDLVIDLHHRFTGDKCSPDQIFICTQKEFEESMLLKLNCDKALFYLGWKPTLNYAHTINLVGDWYKQYYLDKTDILEFTKQQIEFFQNSFLSKYHS